MNKILLFLDLRKWRIFTVLVFLISFKGNVFAQDTQIKGFVDILAGYNENDKKASFTLGEQDFFITSEISDRISFTGESVFKFSGESPTYFDVSIERVVLKYNIKGNHNLLLGKHHTPISYWNDTYHHGRVFFPTIKRPLLFENNIIPLHTTGVALQGDNLGKLRFGYQVMVGNGIGSNDGGDNNTAKSVTASAHFVPIDEWRFGIAAYYDQLSMGEGHNHGGGAMEIEEDINQTLATVSVSHFGKKFEFLTEATFAINDADSTGMHNNTAMYAYAGIKLGEKWVPYLRYDLLNFDKDETYFNPENKQSIVAGLRYEINYLAVVKLEYQYLDPEFAKSNSLITAQFAIGF